MMMHGLANFKLIIRICLPNDRCIKLGQKTQQRFALFNIIEVAQLYDIQYLPLFSEAHHVLNIAATAKKKYRDVVSEFSVTEQLATGDAIGNQNRVKLNPNNTTHF